ncbi:MAG: Asp-tRNA(Asn)/Glu-tRNA(Gln) amidotransferase subunit GatA [Chloroflexi bacterium]|nr:Asp-tRNA(Asn)/Glu-tRNA(Gln) amidotransferase subunit GatA [Chloroflexota bacterium]
MKALHEFTIREAGQLIKSRALSPVELTRTFLDRILALDHKVKAYVTRLPESALAEARAAEVEVLRGSYRGLLHGIPLAHKDLFDTKGVRTTAQSKVFEHRVPEEDATAVARLRQAGSILLGKLAMYEFAVAGPETSLFEPARNPWNLEHIPGASSSGSGAALAAGLCMGSLGSDTAGSVRSPASYCGVVGLKPTYGRVSRYGMVPLSWSLDHAGPMARTVEDTAILLQAIAGNDPKDPTSSQTPVADYGAALHEDIRGIRVGVPAHYCFAEGTGVDPETRAAVEKAFATLSNLGARVEEVVVPSLELAPVAYNVISMSEAFSYHQRNFQSQPHNYVDQFRKRVYLGALFSANDLVQAQRMRRRISRGFADVLRRVDVVALPTSVRPAPRFEGYDPFATMMGVSLTAPFNLTGLPAISIPCGFSLKGLPIGLQIAGNTFDESTVLRVACAYQRATSWHERRPPIWNTDSLASPAT